MTYLQRRKVLTGALAGATALHFRTLRGLVAMQPVDSETPSETCLSLETFPVPAGEHPHDVAPAVNDQRIWYTAQHAGALGLLDPATGGIVTIPLGSGSSPHGVITAANGMAWVTDSGLNALVSVDAETFDLAVYPLAGTNASLNTAAIDSRGVVWFTGQNGVVGRLDPARHIPGEPVEVIEAPRGVGPYGITVSPDDSIYFASLAGSYVGRILPEGDTFRIVELDPPTAGQGTRRVWADSRGVIWSSQWNAGQVASYDPSDGSWREWRLPGDAPQAYAVYVDERDDIWLSDFGSNAILRFDPDTETFVSVPLPDENSAVRQIHSRPGEVWGAASGSDKLVVIRCD